jgi:xylulokinase
MSPKQYILAYDLGTTGTKAILINTMGHIIASGSYNYETNYLRPNWVEQNPKDWKKAIRDTTQQVLTKAKIQPQHIAAVSFSGHMNGAVLVDQKGIPLRSAIIWADQRATQQAETISQLCGNSEVYQLTGNRVSAAYTLAKLLWIKENEPEIFSKTHKVLQAKDYAAFTLCEVFATDYSDASLTQMLDLHQRCWANQILEPLGIPLEKLPTIYPSAKVIGEVTTAAAQETGLQAGTPVVIGGGDGACATVGAGAIREGDIYTYIGSSSWVALTSKNPLLDEQQRTFNFLHLDPEFCVPVGTMQTAGGALDWFDSLLHDGKEQSKLYEELNLAASFVPPGGNGLIFLPYLLGERSPYWNPHARSAFIGLAMPDRRAELARAVLEGVAFNLRIILDILLSRGAKVHAMRLIGGGGKSLVWRQILADIFNLPLLVVNLPAAATAMGAALAGGIGVGIFPDYSVIRDLVPVTEDATPDPKTRERYEALYGIFTDSYKALEPIYERLANLPK